MARAPRVFTWSDGFHRYTVATTARAKALAAWETDRDLFKEGVAQEDSDAPEAAAALAAPGAVIRRATGDFQDIVAGARPVKASKPAKTAPPKPPPKPRVDPALKRELARAREALRDEDRRQRRAETDLDARRQALEAEAQQLSEDHDQRRRALEREIAALERRLEAGT